MKVASLVLLLITCFSCHSQNAKYQLDPKSFQDKISSTPGAVVLDVRTPDEFTSGSIANAQNIDFRDKYFDKKIINLDTLKTYFVYCLSGGRSGSAADFMRKNGFKNVYELSGGMLAWNKANLPVSNNVGQTEISDKISPEQFQLMIKSDKVVLIDFYAPWCGPCKQMLPLLETIAKEYQGKATIIRVNIDENKKLTRQLNIDEIPFFKLYNEGNEKGNFIGQLDRATLERILGSK